MGPLRRAFRLPRRSRRQISDEVEAEIAFHLEERVRQLEEQGHSPSAARTEAARRFGDMERTRSALRLSTLRREGRMRRRERVEGLFQDLRYAVRQLRREPGFTAVAVLVLAVGIAANAVMFGVVDRLLLRPPPHVVAPEAVHRLYTERRFPSGEVATTPNISYARLQELGAAGREVADVAGYLNQELIMGRGAEAEQVVGAYATASLFPLLGVRPEVGRFFGPAEDAAPDGAPVVVLGYGLWQRRFGGDPGVIGTTVRVQSMGRTVVGVAPRGFAGLDLREVELWLPATAVRAEFGMPAEWATTHNFSWIQPVVRLRPGVSPERAAAVFGLGYVRSLAAEHDEEYAAAQQPRVIVAPALAERGPQASASARVSVWLTGVAVAVLLVACANVANLLLARGLRRRREIAVRLALGVGRRRLVGQLVVEGLLLATAGAAVGLLLAYWGGAALRAVLLPDVGNAGGFDARVLVATAAATIVAGLLAGLAPALQVSRPDLAGALRAGAREGGGRRSRLRGALLVAQAALSVVLLVGAGLFVRSLVNARGADLGLDVGRLVYTTVEWRGSQPDSSAPRAALEARLLERLRALPQVEHATSTVALPFRRNMTRSLFTEARDSVPGGGDMYMNAVGPDYFATIGGRLVRGRAFDDGDGAGAAPVMVVGESMARAVWPDRDALGQCLRTANYPTSPCHTVVGVVRNVVQSELATDSTLQYWVPAAQAGAPAVYAYLARVRGDPADAVPEVRAALQALLPGDAHAKTAPFEELVAPSMRSWQLGATMFVAFGALALVIAAAGLYGVIAYHVSQRLHEIGVRRALGARTGQIARTVLGEGLRAVALGLAVGTLVTLAAARWVDPLLYEVSPRDPLTYGTVVAVLLLVALLAGLAPARRAARVDPSVALRAE